MPVPLLTTKFYIPPARPELVSRPRLIERLNASRHPAHRLTLISAPAGFGKTTLLSAWIADSTAADWQFCWLSLDQGDNDPARFWTYVIAALQHGQADIGQDARAMFQAPPPQRPPIETVLTSLINEAATCPGTLILVLDDVHLITAPEVHDALTLLVDRLPPSLHVVLSSRADPPWPLARLRARGAIVELRTEDLRFTPAEAATFLNDVMRLGLAAGDVAALENRTEGWIVGLQMAALSMQGRDDAAAFVQSFSGDHRFILDYLVEEVLERQPGDIQG
ncbi:MAG: AAA family ATPase, partial [Chloroflexi bacterium]|nr:AAA family ATPase [Chloroflexota bacterium]